jgi:dynein heavy chain
LQDYFKTNLEFLKLEKVQFGGSKGNCLVEMVGQVFIEFNELLKVFIHSSYDPMILPEKVPNMLIP